MSDDSISRWTPWIRHPRGYYDRLWVRFALIVGLGVGAHLPALQGEFLWDDKHLVVENPLVRSPLLIFETFRHCLFPDSVGGHYRPVQIVSYIFDYVIWDRDAYGFHFASVLWHVAGACLLYALLRRLISGTSAVSTNENTNLQPQGNSAIPDTLAFFVACFWVVHPVHSAAVDYISGRADSLACVFGAAGWLLYLNGREIRRPALRLCVYGLAALFAFLAICSRESGILWLILFLLYLFAFDKKQTRGAKILTLALCIAIIGVYAGLRQLPEQAQSGEAAVTSNYPNRTVLMLRALGDYGQLLIWPANLHMERSVLDSAAMSDNHWRNAIPIRYLTFAGIAFGCILLYGACRRGPARRIRILGVSWFFLTYLPISNLVSLNATVAEHWLYLPSVGFLIFLAGCAMELPARGRKLVTLACCFVLIGLSVRSFIRSSDWVTPETFYRRTLMAGGTSVRMAVNLAAIYSERGDRAKAETILRKVLRVDPTYLVARNNLASVLSAEGKTAEAEKMYESAKAPTREQREDYPRTWIAALNLARAAHNRNDDDGSLAIIDKARHDYPGTWAVLSFEAELIRRTQGAASALPLVHGFVDNNWWHCDASIALGRLLCDLGDVNGAQSSWLHASWLDVHGVEALNLLAQMDLRLGRFDDAVKIQRRAISRQPEQPRQYLLLNEILTKMGRTEEAKAALVQVSEIEAMAHASAAIN